MKVSIINQLFRLSMILLVAFAITQCRENSDSGTSSTTNSGLTEDVITSLPAEDVSEEEASGLVFMREEEKLARDVYLSLYAKWNARVFSNISNSEQTHTDAIKYLLQKYNIDDPVEYDSLGVFKNETLQALFDTLVVQGSDSLISALKVGALIEEVDIRDIQKELDEHVDNQDIQYVYENLMRGSRNHLRAFVGNLATLGVTYTPQILSQADYDAIINSPRERGNGH